MKSIFALIPFILLGCGSLSTFETARVVKSGEKNLTLGATFTAGRTGNNSSAYGPLPEGKYRISLMDRFELRVKATVGQPELGAKYALVDSETLAIAAGFGVSILNSYLGKSESSSTVTGRFSLIDVALPVYFSFDLAQSFSLYVSPQWRLRVRKDSTPDQYAAVSGGAKIGETRPLFLEVAYVKDLRSDFNAIQLGAALGFVTLDQHPLPEKPAANHAQKRLTKGRYLLGGLLGILPGLGVGHTIQGRYMERGWIFTLTELGLGALTLAILTERSHSESKAIFNALAAALFASGYLVVHGVEIIDVWGADYISSP